MPTEEREQKIKKVVNSRQDAIVILEDIYDPHNAMAVMRTCDAFGIQEIHLIFEKGKEFDPREIGKSSSSSSNKWLDFHFYDSTENCLKDLKAKGYEIYATALEKKSEKLTDIKFEAKKIAFIFGNEKRGLSEKAIELADKTIEIPMVGMVQSLNLSVTAAICIYELYSQRLSSDYSEYQLSQNARNQLLESFLER